MSSNNTSSDDVTTLNDDFVDHQSQRRQQPPPPRHQTVTLVIPWLELEEDRLELYGEEYMFQSPQEQETYIREWLRTEADLPEEADPQNGIRIIFYPARYHSGLKSIFAMGDICSLIPDEEADVCILEEPEHLNWFRHPGQSWTKKFNFVIGIVHTNYKDYASAHYSGLWTAPAIGVMSSAMVRAYCHTVIKLSGSLQTFAEEKEKISNVHGVRSDFLKEGQRRSAAAARTILDSSNCTNNGQFEANNYSDNDSSNNATTTGVYFIGKILWAKGLEKMLELQDFYKHCTGKYFHIDIYGNGPELKEIKRAYHGRKRNRKSDRDETNKLPSEIAINQNSTLMNDNIMASDDDTSNTATSGNDDEINFSDIDTLSSDFDSDGNQLLEEWITYFNALENRTKSAIATHITKLSSTIQKATKEVDDFVPKSLYEWRRTPIPATFPGRVDHAILKEQYKIFINPSLSEVLCTTTAEALAMGKFAIIPVHSSNDFFMQFPNCLAYRNNLEFAANLGWALTHDPEPLTENQQRTFTWEAATERLVQEAAITRREARDRQLLGKNKLDERIAWFHNELSKGTKGDTLRKVLGGGPISDQVKYEMAKKGPDEASYNSEKDDGYGDEEEDQGLSKKFFSSSLERAIRKTFARSTLASNEAP